MRERHVNRRMGRFPSKIVGDASERMTAKVWRCMDCRTVECTEQPQPIPAPCKVCGGIAFKTEPE